MNKIIIGITLFIIVILIVFILRKQKSKEDILAKSVPNKAQMVIDQPINFGYKCSWIAIKSKDKNRISKILNLKNVSPCNWHYGIDGAYSKNIYITPTLGEWTFVVGRSLPSPDNENDIKEIKNLITLLSNEFGETQYFITNRIAELHCWAKAINGKILRFYGYNGEVGENIMVEGQPSTFEQSLNLVNTFSEKSQDEHYLERADTIPDEALVMEIAAQWSINPNELESTNNLTTELGIIGVL